MLLLSHLNLRISVYSGVLGWLICLLVNALLFQASEFFSLAGLEVQTSSHTNKLSNSVFFLKAGIAEKA